MEWFTVKSYKGNGLRGGALGVEGMTVKTIIEVKQFKAC